MKNGAFLFLTLVALLLPIAAVAQSDIPKPGVYTIDLSTNKNHVGAYLTVEKIPGPGNRMGLIFMPVKGKFEFMTLKCGPVVSNTVTNSIGCDSLVGDPASKKETLHVGLLDGILCKGLAKKHNKGEEANYIAKGCEKNKECICYDLDVEAITISSEGDDHTIVEPMGPPEKGAGSGGSGGVP